MKRLLFVGLLMLCLAFPVFGGHTTPGNYCSPCGIDGCFCDPGERPGILNSRSVSDESSQGTPSDLGSETLLILGLLLLMLRYKA